MRWVALFSVAVVGVLFLAHRLVASRPIDAIISLGPGQAHGTTAPPSQRTRLHVAVAHITSPVPGFRSHQSLVERLAAAVNADPELLQPESYKSANAMLRQGKADVAFVCSGGYAAEPDAMDVLGAPVIDGKPVYFALIIVPANSPAQTFADLTGRSFLFVEEESNTGTWYPCRRAREVAGKAAGFFGSTKFTGAHDLSVMAIASNLADGAAISSNIYDRLAAQEPALKDRVRILERSAPFPSPPVVVRKGLPQDMRQRLLTVLLTLQDSDDGREILRGLGFERFVPARNEDYALIEPCRP